MMYGDKKEKKGGKGKEKKGAMMVGVKVMADKMKDKMGKMKGKKSSKKRMK